MYSIGNEFFPTQNETRKNHRILRSWPLLRCQRGDLESSTRLCLKIGLTTNPLSNSSACFSVSLSLFSIKYYKILYHIVKYNIYI